MNMAVFQFDLMAPSWEQPKVPEEIANGRSDMDISRNRR
jgi:hypothetical protein